MPGEQVLGDSSTDTLRHALEADVFQLWNHRTTLREESKRAPQRSTAGRPGRQPRHLQLNHGGVVAGQALVRSIHERLSSAREQDVPPLLRVNTQHNTPVHIIDENFIKKYRCFTSTLNDHTGVRPLNMSVSTKASCLLGLQNSAALVAHYGQLPAGCVLSVVRVPCKAQYAVVIDSRCAPLQPLYPLQNGEWVHLHVSASALHTLRLKCS